MNWKRFLLIAVALGAFAFAGVPRTEARISVGIGIGAPIGYGYGYGNPYGYRRSYYPYDYYGYRRAIVHVGPRYYRHRHYRGCGHRRYVRHHRSHYRYQRNWR